MPIAHQPADAANQHISQHAAETHQRPHRLTHAHQPERRDTVAQGAEEGKDQVARQRFDKERETRPRDLACRLKYDEWYEKQQNLIGETRDKQRAEQSLMVDAHRSCPAGHGSRPILSKIAASWPGRPTVLHGGPASTAALTAASRRCFSPRDRPVRARRYPA